MSATVELEIDDLHELAAMNLMEDDDDLEEFCQDVLENTLYSAYQQQE